MTEPQFTYLVRYDSAKKVFRASRFRHTKPEGIGKTAGAALRTLRRKLQAALPKPARKNAKRLYIARTRMHSGTGRRSTTTCGWQVRFPPAKLPKGHVAAKYFGDQAWGGERYSLAAALTWRNREARRLGIKL